MMFLPHLASRLIGTPLLLARAKLDVLLAVLGERVGAPQVSVAAFEPVIAPSVRTQSSIAVIPVFGTLVRRTNGLEAASGLTSYSELAARLQAASVDTAVRGVLLEIDSPGGEAGGVFELAEHVRTLAQHKPVWAVAVDSALSAAYAIAAAANRVVVTRTAGVGSIGVIAMHIDQSARDVQQGYRYTPVLAGAYKADLSPHAALAPEALTRLKREVDRLYDLFVDHVALMRGLDSDAIRATGVRPVPFAPSQPAWAPRRTADPHPHNQGHHHVDRTQRHSFSEQTGSTRRRARRVGAHRRSRRGHREGRGGAGDALCACRTDCRGPSHPQLRRRASDRRNVRVGRSR
ncbi:MAG: S49 family peptidase [Xanthomonadales bacterium PRO6]|nr:S49 family peptidase [Xanthomonadales bacterium PRO6]